MRQKAPVSKKAVMFTNWTTKPFRWTWDGVEYRFEPGQGSMMLEGMALCFGKHLADQVINEQDAWAKYNSNKLPIYQELVMKAVKDVDSISVAEAVSDGEATKQEIEMMNANAKSEKELRAQMAKENGFDRFCDSCDSKGVRHKKGCPKALKKEAEFEGMKV